MTEQNADSDQGPRSPEPVPLRLVAVPFLLVAGLALAVLLLSWLAHRDRDPSDLVRALSRRRTGGWQEAVTLAAVLRSPRYEAWKRDQRAAGELISLLERELDSGAADAGSLRLRAFLCRAVGELHRGEAIGPLVLAAQTERDPGEIEVRQSAAEALAVLAGNIGPEMLRYHQSCVETLISLTRPGASANPDSQRQAALRGAAAFALGVVGGTFAELRLVQLLDDPGEDVRANAAIGLARLGNAASLPMLSAMLDPPGSGAEGEATERGRVWKREHVSANAIRAVLRLVELCPDVDREGVEKALSSAADGANSEAIRGQARLALQALQAKHP